LQSQDSRGRGYTLALVGGELILGSSSDKVDTIELSVNPPDPAAKAVRKYPVMGPYGETHSAIIDITAL
jgi:hypothetical protein